MIRYRPSYHCSVCGTAWKGKPTSTVGVNTPNEDAEYKLAMYGTPPCPKCGSYTEPRGMDMSLNKAPATVGQNTQVKAIDKTAEIVMQDYGMTDLRTNVRMGETAAPKIAPQLQVQADNFFVGGRKRHPHLPNKASMSPAFLGKAAMAGAYRQGGTVETLNPSLRPPVNVIASTDKPRR